MDDFVTMETTNQHARGIIGEEMNKIQKLPQGQLWHRLTLRSKKPGERTKSQKI